MASIEFNDMEKDAISEVMNISMGNAATAASELLNAKVWITTPRVDVIRANELKKESLEPAVCVKIVYVKGISGTNLMVLKQDDVQLILNQLMGQPLEISPDFEFDELNISAVSEVMNQMMGSSATALSSFLGMHIDISTPTPYIMDKINLADVQDHEPDDTIVTITFDLTIEGVIKSEFVSILNIDLARIIADKIVSDATAVAEETVASAPVPVSSAPPTAASRPAASPPPVQQGYQPSPPPLDYGAPPMYGPPPPMMNPYGYPPQNPYGYGYVPNMQPINIQSAQLHQFDDSYQELSGEQKDNLKLLMGVPLQISVEIGTARRKVKDILEFTQGTIIELERQAGAPVDVVVNGNLVAKGDVVVIDDNFAVRITEMIKSKFMDSLGKE
ncbi:MAG: flagellar motor switch phosphatase FliY [Eubacterium sp.]|jgi:flagellar motor switch protein FliN/FliY|nr:flagellar motor switch phosphatase FliY [Eubacterium sp.]